MKTGILLLNMGGPEKIEYVEPYLYNIFADPFILPVPFFLRPFLKRRIVKSRLSAAEEKYRKIGGGTPLLQLSLRLAWALETRLARDDMQVYLAPGMRYWHPFIEEGVQKLLSNKVDRIIAVSMYPHYSRAMTGSSMRELQKVCKKLRCAQKLFFIDRWGNEPGYIKLMTNRIRQHLGRMPQNTHILFTAHNLPAGFIKKGDPYRKEVEDTVAQIIKNFPDSSYTLAYQSRSGPVKWLEPTVEGALSSLSGKGTDNVLLVSLSFAVDNLETLYEIDIEYAELAKSLGIHLRRLATFNDDPDFVEFLATVIRRKMDHEEQ